MAEKKFAKEVSSFKYAMIASQKTLLSQVSEILPAKNIISREDFFTKKSKRPLVLAIFGDSLSIVYDAVNYLERYYKKYQSYPTILCLPGASLSQYVRWGSIDAYMREILINGGIPEKYIYSFGRDIAKENPVALVKEFITGAEGYIYDIPVAVFSPRGYSVSTLLALKKALPDTEFFAFSKEYLSEEYMSKNSMRSTCIFDTDRLDSIGMDLMLGELVRMHLSYETLPEYFQEHIMPLEKVTKFIDKGYILGLNSVEEMEAVGLTPDMFMDMATSRMSDFEWIHNVPKRIKELMASVE